MCQLHLKHSLQQCNYRNYDQSRQSPLICSMKFCTQEALRVCLNKRKVSSTENCLCFTNSIDFACPCLFTLLIVFQQEVAVIVEGLDVILGRIKLCLCCLLGIIVRLELRLHRCLRSLLICQILGVTCTLFSSIGHGFFI